MSKTIVETRKELVDGTKSVTEVVSESLKIIKDKEKLNAFITLVEDEALKRAAWLEKNGDRSLPLFGVPVALKDMYLTKGIRTTAGAKLLEEYVPPYSSSVVEKLEEAGAVIVGKTNQDAWAHGASGENSDFGPSLNPSNEEYVPGGSSSGSAVAVAAGMVPLAMGTDTGGSIRQPANFVGVVGFKPSYGRVSRYGVIAMASSLDSMGHFTNSVEDAALVLGVTAGADERDATTRAARKYEFEGFSKKGLEGVRVGIAKEYVEAIADEEIKENFEKVKSKLERLGATLVDVALPHTKDAIAVYYILQPAEVSSNLARFDGVRYGKGRDSFGKEAKRRIVVGSYTLSSGYYDAYYRQALRVRTLVKQDFERAFEKVDVLVTPVSPTTAFKLGEKTSDPLAMYMADALTVPVNLAGLPAIAIPSGKTKGGLPMGVQVIGRYMDEERMLPISYELESELI
ncbi:Asp-tRNA(Asn)/Glu-tRNA(Gln) amidotransferase subunit GatA [Candidatus Chazhemtobacterium aquaticus]|uniref:Glutamyl-tRNA(Gln) amidotransferase subunit A n=1 Tax=Candidatus Chazhemtobacterium aquaticus TaxID=2715735 RepID=A0A857N8H3_9BACT|nr:Asp-tRNA(Asn)/Glu-tRNA(Gln) amidotransferase subunit GatA [Candidatus Chazhemtobacterium aquaticus]QHO63623.1 Aspartyl-tRNA(Asn) amidotransferase subunit A [Candidatus Chazhemtobacterium aquaticus]